MNILIVGCGKIGYSLARTLSNEGNSVVVIDIRESMEKQQNIDALFIKGNGLSPAILIEAGVTEADLIICVTANDETNILCCLTAGQLGAKHTVARVRNPRYALELNEFKDYFGLNVIINPEQQAALEISRLLRFPVAGGIESFAGGKVEFITFRTEGNEFYAGKKLSESFHQKDFRILVGVVIREDSAYIPNGNFIPQKDDILGIVGKSADVYNFLGSIKKTSSKINDILLIGGGKITQYLIKDLASYKSMNLKVIEKDYDRCLELDDMFGDSITVIHGDGANTDLLDSEDLASTQAIICLTDWDEDNVLIGLYAKFRNVPKVIIKNNHINDQLVRNLHLDSVVCPKNLTTDQIVQYVRGLDNAYSMEEIKSLHTIISSPNNDVETLEFQIHSQTPFIGTPLRKLNIKKEILIASVVRKNTIIIPTGDTELLAGDHIIVIAKNSTLAQINDIIE